MQKFEKRCESMRWKVRKAIMDDNKGNTFHTYQWTWEIRMLILCSDRMGSEAIANSREYRRQYERSFRDGRAMLEVRFRYEWLWNVSFSPLYFCNNSVYSIVKNISEKFCTTQWSNSAASKIMDNVPVSSKKATHAPDSNRRTTWSPLRHHMVLLSGYERTNK